MQTVSQSPNRVGTVISFAFLALTVALVIGTVASASNGPW